MVLLVYLQYNLAYTVCLRVSQLKFLHQNMTLKTIVASHLHPQSRSSLDFSLLSKCRVICNILKKKAQLMSSAVLTNIRCFSFRNYMDTISSTSQTDLLMSGFLLLICWGGAWKLFFWEPLLWAEISVLPFFVIDLMSMLVLFAQKKNILCNVLFLVSVTVRASVFLLRLKRNDNNPPVNSFTNSWR